MRHGRGRFVALASLLLVALSSTPAVIAADPPSIVVADGVTQPVFGYSDAVRQRVWVQADFDSDLNGDLDMVAMDIIRPAATEDGLKVPVIMDASPYYTTVCRGNEGECIADTDNDGLNDRWPLFYDNYFVPRGYAVILLHMAGTGFSNGCPVTGGTPDNLSAPAAIDWLNGRRTGWDADGNEVVADWHNGKTGMIGKSYDGTLANAAAATGVEGLTTIVPISAISSWYFYTRMAGIRFNTNYPSSLSNTVTNPDRRAYCSPIRTILNNTDGDESGDFTPFWFERDYLHDLDNVTASVFVVHGLQDDNVKTNNFAEWWYGLQERNVPSKLWLTRTGHVDPFDFRRAEWVATIHRWFDHWLQGVDNGIMKEPKVDIETDADVFETHKKWPLQTAVPTHLWFQDGSTAGPGAFGLQPQQGKPKTASWQDRSNQSENAAIGNLTGANPNRIVYLSDPLEAPIRISGTPTIELNAAVDQEDTNFGAVLVDFGPSTSHVSRTGDGILTLGAATEDCWGESSPADDPCYRQTQKRLANATTWRVTRGIVDALNINDVTTGTPLVPGQFYPFSFDLYAIDYTFEVGHQIGVVLVGSYNSFSVADTNAANITISIKNSRVSLPIVGGHQAALGAGF